MTAKTLIEFLKDSKDDAKVYMHTANKNYEAPIILLSKDCDNHVYLYTCEDVWAVAFVVKETVMALPVPDDCLDSETYIKLLIASSVNDEFKDVQDARMFVETAVEFIRQFPDCELTHEIERFIDLYLKSLHM